MLLEDVNGFLSNTKPVFPESFLDVIRVEISRHNFIDKQKITNSIDQQGTNHLISVLVFLVNKSH